MPKPPPAPTAPHRAAGRRALLGLALAGTLAPALLRAQARPADAPRGRDHPLLPRFPGAWLAAHQTVARDAVRIPAGAAAEAAVTPRGQVTRLFYLAPAGRTVTEVQRHLQATLERAGAVRRDQCADSGCGARDFTPLHGEVRGMTLARDGIEGWGARALVEAWQQPGTEQFWYGTLVQGARTLHLAVLTARPGQRALAERYAASVVLVVEPDDAAAATSTPVQDAAAIARALQTDGRIPLYGLAFDEGRAELRPDSRTQLEEVARALQRHPDWRVALVGHLDARSSADAALQLSRARAQAVADALVRTHGVAAARLSVAGVGPYAPLAPHATETGRALNRRVELVLL
jgi:outer membrane protein OmpA-like peptidoglycan-associated protein